MTNPIQKLGLDTIEQSQIARIAGINLTLGGLVSAGVILLIAFAAHWLVTRSLRRVRERSDRSRQAIYLLERLAGYGIIVVGIMSALSAAGLNLSSLTVFAGALGGSDEIVEARGRGHQFGQVPIGEDEPGQRGDNAGKG